MDKVSRGDEVTDDDEPSSWTTTPANKGIIARFARSGKQMNLAKSRALDRRQLEPSKQQILAAEATAEKTRLQREAVRWIHTGGGLQSWSCRDQVSCRSRQRPGLQSSSQTADELLSPSLSKEKPSRPQRLGLLPW